MCTEIITTKDKFNRKMIPLPTILNGDYCQGTLYTYPETFNIKGNFLKSSIIDPKYNDIAKMLGHQSITKANFEDIRSHENVTDEDIDDIKHLDKMVDIFTMLYKNGQLTDQQIDIHNIPIDIDSLDEIAEIDSFDSDKTFDYEKMYTELENVWKSIPNAIIEPAKERMSKRKSSGFSYLSIYNKNNKRMCQCCLKEGWWLNTIKCVEIRPDTPLFAWDEMNLSLCPFDEAYYRNMILNNPVAYANFKNNINNTIIDNSKAITISITRKKSITFKPEHLAAIKKIFELESNDDINKEKWLKITEKDKIPRDIKSPREDICYDENWWDYTSEQSNNLYYHKYYERYMAENKEMFSFLFNKKINSNRLNIAIIGGGNGWELSAINDLLSSYFYNFKIDCTIIDKIIWKKNDFSKCISERIENICIKKEDMFKFLSSSASEYDILFFARCINYTDFNDYLVNLKKLICKSNFKGTLAFAQIELDAKKENSHNFQELFKETFMDIVKPVDLLNRSLTTLYVGEMK